MPTGYMDQDFETAQKVVDAYRLLWRDSIAKAIAEERERCAEIAVSMGGNRIADALRMGAVMTPTRSVSKLTRILRYLSSAGNITDRVHCVIFIERTALSSRNL